MNKRNGVVLYLSLSLNIVFLLLIIFAKLGALQYLSGIKEYFSHNKKILFLGDSLTEQTKWDDLYPDVTVVNSAKGGNLTDTIPSNLNIDLANKASKIFLMAGVDDLARGKTPEETIKSSLLY